MVVCFSIGVGFDLQTRQCLVYWSHSYSILSWESGGLSPEKFSSSEPSTTPESAPLQDRRDRKSSV